MAGVSRRFGTPSPTLPTRGRVLAGVYGAIPPRARSSTSPLVGEVGRGVKSERQFGIAIGIEQVLEFAGITDGDLVDPAIAFGRGIDEAGLVAEGGIDLGDGARDRSVDFGSRLDAFDHSGLVAFLEDL